MNYFGGFLMITLVLSLTKCQNKEVRKEYYDNGQIRLKASYQDGQLNGTTKLYFKNGDLKKVENYKDGKPHGEMKKYYKNGQVKVKGKFKHGKQTGIIKWYYKNGQIKKINEYKNDRLEGKIKQYYRNGQLKFFGIMQGDTLTTFYEKYEKDGSFDGEFREIKVMPNHDTLTLGDKVQFQVSCYGPIDSVLFIDAGYYDKPFRNYDSLFPDTLTPQLTKVSKVETNKGITGYKYTLNLPYKTGDEFRYVDSSNIVQKRKRGSKNFTFSYEPERAGKLTLLGFYKVRRRIDKVGHDYPFKIHLYVKEKRADKAM